jgi:lactoylglutathione lyase
VQYLVPESIDDTEVDSEQTVDDFHDRFADEGFTVTNTEVRHGAYDFYVEAPGGFSVEVGAQAWD